MGDKTIHLTADGKKKLEKELDHLRTVKRHEISERILQAKSSGDIEDNSDYEDAKTEQIWVETRIREIESTLAHSQVIVPDTNGKAEDRCATFGATVTIVDETGYKETYQLVSSAEADGADGKISNESPFGSAMFGKRKGDSFKVAAPAGELKFTIVTID
jgi:transcription elongation factor GreA